MLVLAVLCLMAGVSAATYNCSKRANETSFGTLAEKFTFCEIQYAHFSPGAKSLEFHSDTNDLHGTPLRLSFVKGQLWFIPVNLFDTFTYLEVLEMTEIGLRNLLSNSFKKAGNLKVFHAVGNKLTSLPYNAFEGTRVLEYIDLSNNQIANINYEAFKDLEKLRELGISNNRLSIIDEQTFQPLKSLEWIWLDRNMIEIISVNLFINSPQLHGIHLNDNDISAISPILLDQLLDLRFLFLSGNNCTTKNFINTKIAENSSVKKDLSKCFKEYRLVVPEEEERFRLRNILKNAEKANKQCEHDKQELQQRLNHQREQLESLQKDKNGK